MKASGKEECRVVVFTLSGLARLLECFLTAIIGGAQRQHSNAASAPFVPGLCSGLFISAAQHIPGHCGPQRGPPCAV